MVTVRMQIAPHLAEYIRGKFYDPELGCVRFPPGMDIYILIYDLLQRRPKDAPIDSGNLEFALPDRREANHAGGKDPLTYNYLSARSQKRLRDKMELMMWAEVHDFMDENKHAEGITFKDSANEFICKYMIESISDDALLKHYQRWRDKTRRRYKRNYTFRKEKKHKKD